MALNKRSNAKRKRSLGKYVPLSGLADDAQRLRAGNARSRLASPSSRRCLVPLDSECADESVHVRSCYLELPRCIHDTPARLLKRLADEARLETPRRLLKRGVRIFCTEGLARPSLRTGGRKHVSPLDPRQALAGGSNDGNLERIRQAAGCFRATATAKASRR